jgi:hypothetical protein
LNLKPLETKTVAGAKEPMKLLIKLRIGQPGIVRRLLEAAAGTIEAGDTMSLILP